MQLTLQLPQACSSLDSSCETSSNASSGMSSPAWATVTCDGGPATPAGKCEGLLTAGQQHKECRTVYRRLELTVPSSPVMPAEESSCTLSACRVLSTTDSYSSVCDWLEQQVSKHVGPKGALVAACSHTLVCLDPALEVPATPAPQDEPALPAPAFQLLGLL
jgi:hypothetical protein